MKTCTKCKKTHPSTTEYFYKQKGASDGLSSWCKECMIERQKKYYYKNQKRYSDYKKEYYKNNKEKFSYDNRDQEKYKEISRRYRQSERGKKKFKEYRLAREQNKTHDISKEEWIACKEYFNWSCAYCGLSEEDHKKMHNQQLHKEHVQHDGSNKLDNCVPSCRSCNSRKHTTSFEEWYTEANENYTYDKYKQIIKWLSYDFKKYIRQ